MALSASASASSNIRIFVWQFSSRMQGWRPSESHLLYGGLSMTLCGENLANARAQFFTPPTPHDNYKGIFYQPKSSAKKYSSIQDLILQEEPTITSNGGCVFMNTKSK